MCSVSNFKYSMLSSPLTPLESFHQPLKQDVLKSTFSMSFIISGLDSNLESLREIIFQYESAFY